MTLGSNREVQNGHGATEQLVYWKYSNVSLYSREETAEYRWDIRKKGALSNFASVGDTSKPKSITYFSKCRCVQSRKSLKYINYWA